MRPCVWLAMSGPEAVELPGVLVPPAHVEHCAHRYAMAAGLVRDRAVLEVACGAGAGLGPLRRSAHTLIAGDRSVRNLMLARGHYGRRASLVAFDAHHLPFRSSSFDAVVMIEAVYFLADPAAAAAEAHRVLRPGGLLFVSTVNPAWPDFQAHPDAHRYLDSRDLVALLRSSGFTSEVFAAFPSGRDARTRAVSALRRLAWRLRLFERWPGLRLVLRRAAYGPLVPFPEEVDVATGVDHESSRIEPTERDARHLYLYAVGHRR